MPHLSPEFWAILVVGALIWWAIADGINRIEKALDELGQSLRTIEHNSEKAPWVANEPEPYIGELGSESRT